MLSLTRSRKSGLVIVLSAWIGIGCRSEPSTVATNNPGHESTGGGSSTSTAMMGGSNQPDPQPGDGPMVASNDKCLLTMPAFCDNFEEGASAVRGRGGDLDPLKWSGGRIHPQLPTGGGLAVWVGPATIGTCRQPFSGKAVLPDDDTLVCDATPEIGSHHLLTAAASQNYGLNSYRIRQPFDFAGRTGKITFDVEPLVDQLGGWTAIAVTEEPTPTPSFQGETGIYPKTGIEIHFDRPCDNGAVVGQLNVYKDYVETVISKEENQKPKFPGPNDDGCFLTKKGRLNHFEVRLSQTLVEVYASDTSPNGSSYPNFRKVFAADLQLGFSRGYVNITTHNHATIKYHQGDAWLARWDNVGFDGPVVTNWREVSIPDSLKAGMSEGVAGKDVGYALPDAAAGSKALTFSGVNVAGVTSARLAFTGWVNPGGGADFTKYDIRYRLNGGAWHDRFLTKTEAAALSVTNFQGAMNLTIDVPPTELKDGDNTADFATKGIDQSYPPAVANMDLVLTTN